MLQATDAQGLKDDRGQALVILALSMESCHSSPTCTARLPLRPKGTGSPIIIL
jgi:hypothetical protein